MAGADRDKDVEQLLPWLANETLEGEEARAVEALTKESPAAAQDLEFMRGLRTQMKAEEAGNSPGELGWRRLQQQIARERGASMRGTRWRQCRRHRSGGASSCCRPASSAISGAGTGDHRGRRRRDAAGALCAYRKRDGDPRDVAADRWHDRRRAGLARRLSREDRRCGGPIRQLAAKALAALRARSDIVLQAEEEAP